MVLMMWSFLDSGDSISTFSIFAWQITKNGWRPHSKVATTVYVPYIERCGCWICSSLGRWNYTEKGWLFVDLMVKFIEYIHYSYWKTTTQLEFNLLRSQARGFRWMQWIYGSKTGKVLTSVQYFSESQASLDEKGGYQKLDCYFL